jgi:hypothetical protein
MSQVKIKRFFRSVDITLHTATALATTMRVEDVAGGVVSLGTISTNAVSLQTWGALTADAAFRRLYNADGSVADITLAASSTEGRMYALPDAAFGLPFMKIVSATTNSTGTAGVVMLKT